MNSIAPHAVNVFRNSQTPEPAYISVWLAFAHVHPVDPRKRLYRPRLYYRPTGLPSPYSR